MQESLPENYLTITKQGTAEFNHRGSKFIALAFPIQNKDDFKLAMQQIKSLHPKASHYCFAYKLGLDKNNFRLSDAGEPYGSAGKPIINAIESRNLTNILVIVVRYFGGSLLGIPGLIDAYRTSTLLVLQTTQIIQKSILIYYELEFNYMQTNIVMQILKKQEATILENKTQLFCKLSIALPIARKIEFLYNFSNLHQIILKETPK